MGTNKGAVRIILWPLEDVNLEMEMINPNSNQVKFKHPEYYELQVHSAPITSMALSWDG